MEARGQLSQLLYPVFYQHPELRVPRLLPWEQAAKRGAARDRSSSCMGTRAAGKWVFHSALVATEDLKRQYIPWHFSTTIPPVLWFDVGHAPNTCRMGEEKIQVKITGKGAGLQCLWRPWPTKRDVQGDLCGNLQNSKPSLSSLSSSFPSSQGPVAAPTCIPSLCIDKDQLSYKSGVGKVGVEGIGVQTRP